MRKPNQKQRKVLRVVFFAVVVLLVLCSFYAHRRIVRLEDRVTNLEGRTVGAEAEHVDEEFSDESVDVAFVSRSSERLRVETGWQAEGSIYEEKDVHVFTVEITNSTSTAFDVASANIRAQTDGGVLLSQVNVHPEDNSQSLVIELAPGGKAKVALYYVTNNDQVIKNLFHESGIVPGVIKID